MATNANKELLEALNQIEKEKDISKEILLEAIENSLLAACKNAQDHDESQCQGKEFLHVHNFSSIVDFYYTTEMLCYISCCIQYIICIQNLELPKNSSLRIQMSLRY